MSVPSFIPLQKAMEYPSSQVGRKAIELSKLLQTKVPIAPGFVIPTETFKQIILKNNLAEKISIITDQTDWTNSYSSKKALTKIKRLIINQEIPTQITKQLFEHYQKILLDKKSFVKIVDKDSKIDNIRGEVNLIDSVLRQWAGDISQNNWVPSPQIITSQTQPLSSGLAKINLQQKHLIIIKTNWGVFTKKLGQNNQPDLFEVDTRTWHITSRHINPQKTKYQRQLDKLVRTKNSNPTQNPITDHLALEIAKITQQVNRKFIGHKKIYFEIYQNKIFITDVVSQASETKTNQTKNPAPHLIGRSICGGHIEGQTYFVSTNQTARSFPVGDILVKKELTHSDLDLVKKVSAIVCESSTLNPAILTAIKTHHIPCVIGVKFATTKLKSAQRVIVDAGSGHIHFATNKQKVKLLKSDKIKTITKIYLSAGNPYHIDRYPDQNDGIFLKSDYSIAFLGIHPNHFIKNRQNILKEQIKRNILTFMKHSGPGFFYRPCNLNSQELRSLKHSENYETPEPNPYLGTRGALRAIQDSLLFELELKIASELASKHKKEINFVLPFVRTASELAIIFNLINKIIPKSQYLRFWLQLNTPANVLNLKEFLKFPISGISIQAKTIHDLSYGIDPDNPELHHHYTFDADLIEKMLNEIVKTTRHNLPTNARSSDPMPIILKLNSFNAQLVSLATNLGLRAIVVKPSLSAIVKQQLISTEEKLLLS